ncbi:MAG: nucleotidyltransferase domain-containing protein [Methanosarcinales archaeon]
MKEEDKRLIQKLVEKVKDLPNLECIVLFGSFVKGEEDKRSDIDLLIVFNSDTPNKYISQVSEIITSLKPHREIHTVLTNLSDYDTSFFNSVFREGKVLFGKVFLTPKKLGMQAYKLIHYDLSNLENSVKVKISRRVYGYVSEKKINGEIKRYVYKGLKEYPRVILISKATLLIPEKREG